MLVLILGVVIVMAVPEYAPAQQRERAGRSETGRTAEPREEVARAAPARRSRRPEPRGETPTRRKQRPTSNPVRFNDEPSRADRARHTRLGVEQNRAVRV